VRRVATAAVLALAGCGASVSRVGLLGADPDLVGIKLLRPNVTGRSCRSSVLGVPTQAGSPSIEEALGQLLALDEEGNLVSHAEVRWQRLVTGVYNRTCVEVHGDLARGVTTVVLPMPGHEHHHGP
jgi:hypothetical protein